MKVPSENFKINQERLDLPLTTVGSNSNIRSGSIIYCGSSIGDNFVTGHNVLIREKNLIGDNVSIGSGSIIEHSIVIGDNVRLHSSCFIPEFTIIEDGAWIGPCVTLTNSKYPNQTWSKDKLQACKISRGAIIGANVTILPGVVIGENCLVGAGSVVTKSVPSGKVVFGVPAKVMSDNNYR